MSESNQVLNLIDSEYSRVSGLEVKTAEEYCKVAGALSGVVLPAVLAAGGGLAAGALYRDSQLKKEIEELKTKNMQRNAVSAGLGAIAALKLRKPVRGLLAPDPEDLTSLEQEEFDDIWKQRARMR
jgi:DNA topoisomerase VI subunit B